MDEFQKFYIIATRFLSYRPRSEKEIRDKLISKKASPEILEKVITTLTEQRFLNDLEFAQMWLRSRTESKPKSLWLVRRELQQKGISQEIIEELLGEKDKSSSDLASAKVIVEKRIHKYKDLPRQEIYTKLGSFLARRGFGWDIIKQSIDDTLSVEYNES